MGILLEPNKRFVAIELYYVEEVKTHGNSVFSFIRTREELEDWKKKGYTVEGDQTQPQPDPAKKSPKLINKLVTHWTKPAWKEQNTLISRSLRTTTSEGRAINEIDGVKYRDLKLKLCLKKWSLLDEASGQPVPVTPEVIDMLDPSVAQELLSSFERVTEPTPEDLKD